MKELLEKLVALQKIENEAEEMRVRQGKLPVSLAKLDEEFGAFKAAMEQRQGEFEERQKLKREKDRQLQTSQDALKKARGRLSEVKTNKEYQALLKEIEVSEAKNGKLEEEIISLLDTIDASSGEVKRIAHDLEESRLAYEEKKRVLQADGDSLAGKLTGLLQEAQRMRQEIPADVIRKYDRIKAFANGVAVVPVVREVCSGCHMAIPPQMYNELYDSREIITCPNCNRIIYREVAAS